MAFTVQDDNGLVAGANAYVTTAYVRAYHLDRGVDLTAVLDPALQTAIVLSTSYLDARFTFLGCRRNTAQETEWPRRDAYDRDGYVINGIPKAVKQAVAELANKARSAVLMPDPERDTTGRTVLSKSEGVGPLTQSVAYAAGGAFTFPEYPLVDRLLIAAGLIRTGVTSVRV
jgi:hypothetical protein